jgi:hypothetical protein
LVWVWDEEEEWGAISWLGRLDPLPNPLLQALQHIPVVLPNLVAVLLFPDPSSLFF